MDDSQKILENLLEHLVISQEQKDNVVCPVCLDLLKNPVNFSPCGHNCCEQCASGLQTKECPLCRKPIQQIAADFTLRNIIKAFPVKCVCNKEIPQQAIEAHLATCPNVRVFCSYECGELIVRSQLKTHQEQCPNRKVLCECSQQIPFLQLETHKEQECQFEKPCQYCSNKVKVKDLKQHYNTCTSRFRHLLRELLPEVSSEVHDVLLENSKSDLQQLLKLIAEIYSIEQCVEIFNTKHNADKFLIPQLLKLANVQPQDKHAIICWPNCVWILMRSKECANSLIKTLKEIGFPFVREPRAANNEFYLGKIENLQFCPPLSLIDCLFTSCNSSPDIDCPFRHKQQKFPKECQFWKVGILCKNKACQFNHPAKRVLRNEFRSVPPNPCKYCHESRSHYSWECPVKSNYEKKLQKIATKLESLLRKSPLSVFEVHQKLEETMKQSITRKEIESVLNRNAHKFNKHLQYKHICLIGYCPTASNQKRPLPATQPSNLITRVKDIQMIWKNWKPKERPWSEAEWKSIAAEMKTVIYRFFSAVDLKQQLRQALINLVQYFDKDPVDPLVCCQLFRSRAEVICNIAIQELFPNEAQELFKENFFQKIEKLKSIDNNWASNLHPIRKIGNKAIHSQNAQISHDKVLKMFVNFCEALRLLHNMENQPPR